MSRIVPNPPKLNLNLEFVWYEGREVPTLIVGRTDDDRPIRIRYRNGWLQVWLGTSGSLKTDDKMVIDHQIGPPLHGVVLIEQVCALLGLNVRGCLPDASRKIRKLSGRACSTFDFSGETSIWHRDVMTSISGFDAWLRELKKAIPDISAITLFEADEFRERVAPGWGDDVYETVDFKTGAVPIKTFQDPHPSFPAASDALGWFERYDRMVALYGDLKAVDAFMRESDPHRQHELMRGLITSQSQSPLTEKKETSPLGQLKVERRIRWHPLFDDQGIRELIGPARQHRPSRIALENRLLRLGYQEHRDGQPRQRGQITAENIVKTVQGTSKQRNAKAYRPWRLRCIDHAEFWLESAQEAGRFGCALDLRLGVPRHLAAREAALQADSVSHPHANDWLSMELEIQLRGFGSRFSHMIDGEPVKPVIVEEDGETFDVFTRPSTGEEIAVRATPGSILIEADAGRDHGPELLAQVEASFDQHFTRRMAVMDLDSGERIHEESEGHWFSRDLVDICQLDPATYAFITTDHETQRVVGWRPLDDRA